MTTEFASHVIAMKHSGRPETGEFAASLASLS
jgi:hypothetical protein